MIIDAHHHFWRYAPGEFAWISEPMAKIRRDFLPTDLHRELTAAGIQGVVSVQARQSIAETEWLLELAAAHDFIRGVVGWVPLAKPEGRAELARFAAHPKFKGVRHVVQGETDPHFLRRDDFNTGIRDLAALGLRYDLLILEQQLPEAIAFVDRHPRQVFILDHLAKPRVAHPEFSPWRERMHELARRENVFCKFSGLVTEADFDNWTEAQLRPYWETVLTVFGPRRLMFGSDWPVCLVACSYARWISVVRNFLAPLSADEQRSILSGTAAKAYGLTL